MTEHPLLAALARAGMKMGLARMRSYLEWLGDPHLQYPVIHIAGTNGKGSVCRMVGAILQEQGFKVGITTSPHLQEVNERVRIGTTPISDSELDSLLRRMDTVRRAWASAVVGPTEAFPLTYFEFSTAAAFQHFADQKVDVAVVEVGMGGRLDASNVCAPLATAIVSVGLDHTEQLGPDHGSIAAEKAGIAIVFTGIRNFRH
jgi:dihydrofolate synthase/folylpolyglutamate synthase